MRAARKTPCPCAQRRLPRRTARATPPRMTPAHAPNAPLQAAAMHRSRAHGARRGPRACMTNSLKSTCELVTRKSRRPRERCASSQARVVGRGARKRAGSARSAGKNIPRRKPNDGGLYVCSSPAIRSGTKAYPASAPAPTPAPASSLSTSCAHTSATYHCAQLFSACAHIPSTRNRGPGHGAGMQTGTSKRVLKRK